LDLVLDGVAFDALLGFVHPFVLFDGMAFGGSVSLRTALSERGELVDERISA
jgi:hypothetical protein